MPELVRGQRQAVERRGWPALRRAASVGYAGLKGIAGMHALTIGGEKEGKRLKSWFL
jgi:hypothetical protein